MKSITITTEAKVTLTPEELLAGIHGGLQGLIELVESNGFEVKKKEHTSDNEKVIHAICDRFGLSYHTDKNTILELFRSEILRA